jgi:hypothetical protein
MKFEYMTIYLFFDVNSHAFVRRVIEVDKDNVPLHEFLNQAGQDGWEVCGSAGYRTNTVILKRQIT